MVRGRVSYYHYRDGVKLSINKLLLLGVGIILASLYSAYSLIPTDLPVVGTRDYSVAAQAALPVDTPSPGPDRVIIPKISAEFSYQSGSESVLEEGAWHRFPERGNPEKGGNFILAAHRFSIGFMPNGAQKRSPMYRAEKIALNDQIQIIWNGKVHNYQVSNIERVKPDQTHIEKPTKEHILTLYTCTSGGTNDGRIVIQAKPVN